MRTPIIVANWKMNLGRVDEALGFVRAIRYALNRIEGVDIVLCPPFTVLADLAEVLRPTHIALGAQTMHWEDLGAYTGEISPDMLSGLCRYVIVGHSERRSGQVAFPDPSPASGAESDTGVHRKAKAALAHSLCPIVCVGENLRQYEAGQTDEFVRSQVSAALDGLDREKARRCIIAYEPVWAIGTGKAATPAQANRVIGLTIRGAIADLLDEDTAEAVRVLYGGSVSPENIQAFVRMSDIDGALVGGASLRADFVELVRRAAQPA
jgi:triosephosphate isomerase